MWFDALGQHSWGQIRASGPVNTVMPAAAGAFAMTGVAATFTVKETAVVGSIILSGVSASFAVGYPVTAGAFAYTGVAAPLKVILAPAPGSFSINGYPVNEPIVENLAAGSFLLTGYAANLVRTGFDYDFQQGGVGHYKLDLERAKQLAKMERKAPPPIDLRTAPTFKPIGSPPIAPVAPAPDVAAIQNQRAAEAAAQAQAAVRRKRDIEAILLLAS